LITGIEEKSNDKKGGVHLEEIQMDEFSFDLSVFVWLQSMDLRCTLVITAFELHLGLWG
jgi:hypothetical protein